MYFYSELQELKATLDQRVNETISISGRFRCKPRIESSLSTLPPPLKPVQWAVVQLDEDRYAITYIAVIISYLDIHDVQCNCLYKPQKKNL